MSIHVGTTDSPVFCEDGYGLARWNDGIATALQGRPRLTGGVYHCGQAAWNLWTRRRKTRHERRDERWELLDKVAANLRDISRGYGLTYKWCEDDEDIPF